MLHRHALAPPLPSLLRTSRDLLISVFFVFLAIWPFVAVFVLLREAFRLVF